MLELLVALLDAVDRLLPVSYMLELELVLLQDAHEGVGAIRVVLND